jgi:hypothetical protein
MAVLHKSVEPEQFEVSQRALKQPLLIRLGVEGPIAKANTTTAGTFRFSGFLVVLPICSASTRTPGSLRQSARIQEPMVLRKCLFTNANLTRSQQRDRDKQIWEQ